MVSDSYAASYANKAMDGVYYNGGSWMRIEVCRYVAGKLHGWRNAENAIANRLWAEIHTDENFPTSQEYLATNPKNPFFGYHRVFAWNSSCSRRSRWQSSEPQRWTRILEVEPNK
jgi:hypothetical protein